MKKIGEIITHQNYANRDSDGETIKKQELNSDAKKYVDLVFYRLGKIFPAWSQAWRGATTEETARNMSATKIEWVKAFIENGINSEESIERGLKEARSYQSAFMPSVGQFIGWCKKIDYSVSEAVLAECMEFRKNRGMVGAKSSEISAAANYMLSHFDWFAFNQVKESEGKRAFTERFLKMLDDDKDILNKPKIMMIENKGNSFVRYEDRKKNEVKSRLQKLKSMVR